MINRILILTVIVIFFHSCSVESKRERRNHEILNIIVHDKEKLENKTILLDNYRDTIIMKELNLIGESANDIKINLKDSSLNFFGAHRQFNLHENPFFKNSIDKIIQNISNAPKTIWDAKLIDSKINIVNVDVEKDLLHQERIISWITSNRTNSDYLYVSEPIENKDGELLVCSKIYNKNYCFETIYIFKQDEEIWKTVGKTTLVTRLIVEKIDNNSEKEIEMFRGYIE
jgi:hypothetical protein